MKIVQTDEIPLKRALEHRGGTFHGCIMVEGEPGALDNFQVSFGQMGGDFSSPRHRHNFEQIRYQLEGVLDYGRDGKLTAGMVGYFPDGVYYGPQSQDPSINCKTIVLQFGGANGTGYLSQAEVQAGMAELKQHGEFKDGVFRRRFDVEGKRNMDGYQAIWEHVNGRPMAYPKARYPQPIFMDPANYAWVPLSEQAGVAEKLLGVFTERRGEAGFFRIDAGACFTARGKGVYVILRGEGVVAGSPLRSLTAVYLEPGESVTFTARAETELLHFGLPDLSGLRIPVADAVAA
ncbi:MAG: hypothetical protein ACJ8F3_21790 [Xanthobacteraceae bacterium]